MNNLPITLGFFTSTKGHHSRKTDWRVTLEHWDKQIPLSSFNLVAHLKTSVGEEELGNGMELALQQRGFYVIQTIGNWQRGLSHGAAYLSDQVRVSVDSKTHERPYFLLVEDDSPVLSHGCSLEDLLLQSCQLLSNNHELVTIRTIRKGDYNGGVPQLGDAQEGRAFYSPNTDFQPLLMRSLDFYRLGMMLEQNPQACNQVQCEALWALILRQFSRSPLKHLVWKPEWAESVHIGVPSPDHEAALQRLT